MASLELDSGDPLLNALGVQDMFNVDNSVGQNGPNDAQDVKLVQVLLRLIYFERAGFDPFAKPSEPRPNEIFDDANLEPDGFCGPITKRWVKAFQADRNSRIFLDSVGLGKLTTDGVVGPAPLPKITTRSGTLFTIVAMNVICKRRDPIGFQQLLTQGVDATAAFLFHNLLD